MSDMTDIRFFRKYTFASQTITFGRVLSSILKRISPAKEGVAENDWGTFMHRVYSLGSNKESSPSLLIRRIRALFKTSPALMRMADLLEAFPDAPNVTQHTAMQWLLELETPEQVEVLVQNALNSHINMMLTPDMVTARMENR